MSIHAIAGSQNALAQVKQEASKSRDTEKATQDLNNAVEKQALFSQGAEKTESVDLESSVEELNKAVQNIQRDIHFSIHDETGESVIQVIDRKTEEVVKQFPPEAVLKVSEKLQGLQGVFFEEDA